MLDRFLNTFLIKTNFILRTRIFNDFKASDFYEKKFLQRKGTSKIFQINYEIQETYTTYGHS